MLPSPTAPKNITVVGHGGIGIVEAVGPEVFAIEVGDRVIVNFHASCGWCYNCLQERADQCMNFPGEQLPAADLDGKPVFSGTSGMTEVMVVNQDKVVPIFTDITSPELAMLTCVGNSGLGLTMAHCPVTPGSDVVVFGAGPVGLSAVQGAVGAAKSVGIQPTCTSTTSLRAADWEMIQKQT